MIVTKLAWNEFIHSYAAQHKTPHLLQSAAWGELKSAFGWEAVHIIAADNGAQVLLRSLVPRLGKLSPTIAYIPKGPVGENWEELLPYLDTLCRQRKVVLVKIEPDFWQHEVTELPPSLNLKPSAHAIQPPRTIVVDISASEENILAQMKQKTRYNIRLAEKNGIVVRPSNDLSIFQALMNVTGVRDGFGVHSMDYYRMAHQLFHHEGVDSASDQPICELLIAFYENEPLAGLMVFAYGKRSWYLYGASNDAYRNKMPAYLIQWEAIRWARRLGCTTYDLWGIPDEEEDILEAHFTERNEDLWGVYRFKRGYGGKVLRAAGPWDRVYQPMLYSLYEWWVKRQEGSGAH